MKKICFIAFIVMMLRLGLNAQTVTFSHSGGFYHNSFSLELSCDEDYHIRYTIDGSNPTAKSTLYKQSLYLDESLYSKADIYKIQISPDNLVYVPDSVKHVIVIRAALFDAEENRISKTFTNTYFIRSLGADSHGMAVVSVCADHDDLFDENSGIFVKGVNWESEKPDHTGNYFQHGRDWERWANVEFYEPSDNSGINQICGLRTHGNRSRRQPAKGMKIYARDIYGKKRFKYDFFGDTICNYKHLLLKPFASFWPYSGVQDYVCNKMALNLNMEAPNCRPVVLYLNGEYWGVYFIQEKTDDKFIEDHCYVSPYNCNIIGSWRGEVEHGDNLSFREMMHWFENTNLSTRSAYKQACELIDMDCFIDYYVFQTFIGNFDWPGNNMRCWQENGGKWRWIFFDGDATIIKPDLDVFTNAAVYKDPSDWLNYPQAKLVFGKLLTNNRFRAAFKQRARELCETQFQYENTHPIFNGLIEALRPHIADQQHRFGYPPSEKFWDEGNAMIDDFLANRVDIYLNEPLPAKSHALLIWLLSAIVIIAAGIIVFVIKKSKNR